MRTEIMTNVVRMLIAEDDADTRLLFRKVLEHEGFEVQVAKNGREVLEILKKDPKYDILITDIHMPEKDGMAVLKEALRITPSLKVIMVTAYAEIDLYLQSMREGAFEFVTKPFKIPDLLHVVDRALGRETSSAHEEV